MEKYMKTALEEAKKAYANGDVPVGAVIVNNDKIIAVAHNTKNSTQISINHAEILAIRKACEVLKSWYLDDCIMYVTLKPCSMCEAAIAESRIKKVVYLLDSNYNLASNVDDITYIKSSDIYGYSDMVSDFIKRLRSE